MPSDYDLLLESLVALTASVTALSREANAKKPNEGTLSKLLADLDDARNEVARLIPAASQTTLSFASFFQTVGQSVLDAQKALDRASTEYVNELMRRPREGGAPAVEGEEGPTHAIPSIFRIPKVSAEMKFSLEKRSREEANLIFYSSSAEARERHQQSIQFEIVAVPAPAEVRYPAAKVEGPRPAPVNEAPSGGGPHEAPAPSAEEIAEVMTRLERAVGGAGHRTVGAIPTEARLAAMASEAFDVLLEKGARPAVTVTAEAERRRVFRALRPLVTAAEAEAGVAEDLARKNERRVLVFRDGARDAFFLVVARGGKTPKLAAYHFDRATRSIAVVYRLPRSAAARRPLRPLWRYLSEVARRQARALRPPR